MSTLLKSKGILDPKVIFFLIYFLTEHQYTAYKIMLLTFDCPVRECYLENTTGFLNSEWCVFPTIDHCDR